MDCKCKCAMGTLPQKAPLANPYVPFQSQQSPMYDPSKGFIRGTLFTGLDLPFMGMINHNEKKMTPMVELQTLAFAIQDMALYLDTHRDDTEALEVYRSLQRLYEECRKKYEEKCGPLTHKFAGKGEYQWLDDPWPWEYAKNREA